MTKYVSPYREVGMSAKEATTGQTGLKRHRRRGKVSNPIPSLKEIRGSKLKKMGNGRWK